MMQAAFEEPTGGISRPIELHCDFGQGAALPVVQEKGLALRVGEPRQCIGQLDGQLMTHRLFAGCRLIGG